MCIAIFESLVDTCITLIFFGIPVALNYGKIVTPFFLIKLMLVLFVMFDFLYPQGFVLYVAYILS
jgi:hypothetical protein